MRYPVLTLADIYRVIGYYLRQSSGVDSYIEQREQLANAICVENEP